MAARPGIPRGRRIRQRRERYTRGPWGDVPVRTAHALSHALLDAAVAHVRALALLYVEHSTTDGAINGGSLDFETAATAWWLMEPGIGARSRVARVTSERLKETQKPPRRSAALEGPVNPSDYSETQAQVIVYATDLGLSAAAGDPRIEGEVRPNSTDLITTLFATDSALSRSQAQLVYPVYSGVAHGLLYGIEQFLRPERLRGSSASRGKPIHILTMRWFRTPLPHSSPLWRDSLP